MIQCYHLTYYVDSTRKEKLLCVHVPFIHFVSQSVRGFDWYTRHSSLHKLLTKYKLEVISQEVRWTTRFQYFPEDLQINCTDLRILRIRRLCSKHLPGKRTQCRRTPWTRRIWKHDLELLSIRDRISEEMTRRELETMKKKDVCYVSLYQHQQFIIAVWENQRLIKEVVNQSVREFKDNYEFFMTHEISRSSEFLRRTNRWPWKKNDTSHLDRRARSSRWSEMLYVARRSNSSSDSKDKNTKSQTRSELQSHMKIYRCT